MTETVLGVHGLKARWAQDALRRGLHRDSAAWFLLAPQTPHRRREATLSAAIYLALGFSARERLTAASDRGGYVTVFSRDPQQLPMLLLFTDSPTGTEVTHRYAWLCGGEPEPTARYTKVERAGRRISPHGTSMRLWHAGIDAVAAAEATADSASGGPEWSTDPGLVRRTDGVAAGFSPPRTKIGEFCTALARLVRIDPRQSDGGRR